MRVDVVTIFPDYFAPLSLSLFGRARGRGLIDLHVHDLREAAHDVHRTVDDTPYGGGAGMVMLPGPWGEALDAVVAQGAGPPGAGDAAVVPGADRAVRAVRAAPAPRLVVPTPAGRPFTQALAHELAAEPWLAFACGRYEGIDGRVVDAAREVMPVDEVSIGDYVVNGGEVAVLVIVEAVARLLPGVIGNSASLDEESHSLGGGGLLEAPAYTRPAVWRGRAVPDVLLSGDHGRVDRWRRDESLRRTAERRPELLRALADAGGLDERDLAALAPPH